MKKVFTWVLIVAFCFSFFSFTFLNKLHLNNNETINGEDMSAPFPPPDPDEPEGGEIWPPILPAGPYPPPDDVG